MGTKTKKKPLDNSKSNGYKWRREGDLNPVDLFVSIYLGLPYCTFFNSLDDISMGTRHKKWHQKWHH